jgi:hypothetical protein
MTFWNTFLNISKQKEIADISERTAVFIWGYLANKSQRFTRYFSDLMPIYTGDKSDLYNHLPENQLYRTIKRVGSDFTDEGTEEEPEGGICLRHKRSLSVSEASADALALSQGHHFHVRTYIDQGNASYCRAQPIWRRIYAQNTHNITCKSSS